MRADVSAFPWPLSLPQAVLIIPFPEGFQVGSVIKNPPAKQETQVRSLGQKDPLEKEMATYSSILAWRVPWTEKPGRLQSMGSQS